MSGKAPAFVVGDVVTLKGQAQILTVVPPCSNHAGESIIRDGHVWVAHSHNAGLGFHLVAEAALAKVVKSSHGRLKAR